METMGGIEWQTRDTLALLVLPGEMLLGFMLAKTPMLGNPVFAAILPFALKGVSLLLIIRLYRELLAEQWRRFTKRLWLKLLFCAGLAAGMNGMLSGVRQLLRIAQSAATMDAVTGGIPYGLFLLASFTPILAPVTEEVVFRHVLFYKFRENVWLWALMCLASSFLFGAVHLNNFDGILLLTVPYMAVGCMYNLLYYFSRNIWMPITVHLIYNFSQSVIPAVMIPLLLRGQP